MSHRRVLIAAAAATLLVIGCDTKHTIAPVPMPAEQGPPADSPAHTIRRFEWTFANRAINEYGELFTNDYRFQFASGDSAGNFYRDASPWTREDELLTTRNEFIGGPDKLPAKKIDLSLAQTLVAFNDSRPGKNSRWHQQIRTSVDLIVEIDHGDGSTDAETVVGNALFFLVRGDSAAIPPALAAQGARPDSTRWWIERWEDQTLPGGGALRALPSSNRTWGAIKARYR